MATAAQGRMFSVVILGHAPNHLFFPPAAWLSAGIAKRYHQQQEDDGSHQVCSASVLIAVKEGKPAAALSKEISKGLGLPPESTSADAPDFIL